MQSPQNSTVTILQKACRPKFMGLPFSTISRDRYRDGYSTFCVFLHVRAALFIAKGKRVAAHLLEAADIEFADGNFSVAGTDRHISSSSDP
jgi:hypothetical protein